MSRVIPLLLMFVASLAAQNNPCDSRASLLPSDPAYAEAMKLSRTITEHHIEIRCVVLSKEAQLFDGQLGAAFFRTGAGDFEALFLPPTQSWNELKVIEKREVNGYTTYRFQGSPAYSGTWEGKPVYFVKQRNRLLHSPDEKLAGKLRAALQGN